MAEEFSHTVLIKVVAQICQMVGFEKISTTPLAVLADILKQFILKLARHTMQCAEHRGRSAISLTDLSLAFHNYEILPSELVEFFKFASPLPKSTTVPKFPVRMKKSNTKHDGPGSDGLVEIENVQPDSRENLDSSREPLTIKISLRKIKEACEAKKRKIKKNKQKRKK